MIAIKSINGIELTKKDFKCFKIETGLSTTLMDYGIQLFQVENNKGLVYLCEQFVCLSSFC